MGTPSAAPRIVATDTSVLINLIHVDRLDILGSLDGWEFVAPEQAVEEVSLPEQAQILAEALKEGHLRQETMTEFEELTIYADLLVVMEKGEAACLAMAASRGWFIACDERRGFLAHARDQLGEGRILNTPGILLLSIRQDLISVEEADAIKRRLETRRFKMRFGSFKEVLGRGSQ